MKQDKTSMHYLLLIYLLFFTPPKDLQGVCTQGGVLQVINLNSKAVRVRNTSKEIGGLF